MKTKSQQIVEYYQKYPERKTIITNRKKLMKLLGNKCMKCGFDDYRALQIDHKNGGGLRQVKKYKGSYYIYKHYLENPTARRHDIQLLCANCNWIKRYKNKEVRV